MSKLHRLVRGLDTPWLDAMAGKGRKKDPFRILIACILSLRTQDSTTGAASERLFRAAPDVHALAALSVQKIEKLIYPVGFYRVKARTINALCRDLIARYDAVVPDSIDELLTLKGVGRKTANLVVSLGYGKPGICVDTHVHRITNRWGYLSAKTPLETEFALREKLPARYWRSINGLLVAFGQNVCKPLSPFCSTCPLTQCCDKAGVTKHR
jgi:endonuclease-3